MFTFASVSHLRTGEIGMKETISSLFGMIHDLLQVQPFQVHVNESVDGLEHASQKKPPTDPFQVPSSRTHP